jgi:acetyl esterase
MMEREIVGPIASVNKAGKELTMTTDRISQLRAKYADLKDPGIREFMVLAEELYPENALRFTIAEQRTFYGLYSARFRSPRPPGIKSMDFTVGEVACRLYTSPKPSTAVLLYLHGGGLILGNLDTHDDICADLCHETGLEVVAVQYRLAPENPFPAAFDDCFAVLSHFLRDKRDVIVSGNSSGALLAAALCLKARDLKKSGIRGQVLIAPSLGGDVTKGSYITQANAPGLTTADVLTYRQLHQGAAVKFTEPLLETNFAGLPPAFLVAAGLDPLHDDCFDYAAKLIAAGVAAEVRSEPLLVHDFIRARHMSGPAKNSFKAIVAAIIGFAA